MVYAMKKQKSAKILSLPRLLHNPMERQSGILADCMYLKTSCRYFSTPSSLSRRSACPHLSIK